MSFTEEEVKRAAELKQWAEGRIGELEAEIAEGSWEIIEKETPFRES